MDCKRRYAGLIKSLELLYSTSWKETTFDLNKIWVLAAWKPAFLVNVILNRKIEYQRFFIALLSMHLLQNFGKHLWKQVLSVKFRLAAYAFTGYDFIGQIFSDDISILIETSMGKCSALLHWIVWHGMTQAEDDPLFYKNLDF